MSDVVVGLDIGTSGSKAVAVDASGAVIASARSTHGVDMPHPGYVEQDAEAIWWDESCALLRNLSEQLAGHRVHALAVSGLGPCVVPCDAGQRPLRPAILYGIDARAELEIAELNQLFGSAAIIERGGSALSSQALGPKLAWLRRHEPDVWARTAAWHTASSFLVARLTGEYVLDHHTASQANPLYDLHTSSWADDWIEIVCPGVPMPRLVWPGEVVGIIHDTATTSTGLPVGTPVLGGTVDAWAEAWSVGVRHPGDLMLMYASTMFLVGVSPDSTPYPGLWLTEGVQPGARTLAAGMSTSGLLLSWTADLVGTPVDQLVAAAAEVAPGAEGLLVLPYFAGERSPRFDAGARGVLAGLTLRHTPAHIMRAALEATAFSARHNLSMFVAAAHSASPWRIVAVGGGASQRVWPQIVCDVTREPQFLPSQTIGASYGDALLAGAAVGLFEPDDVSVPGEMLQPQPGLADLYDERFDAYLQLYDATRPVIGRLSQAT